MRHKAASIQDGTRWRSASTAKSTRLSPSAGSREAVTAAFWGAAATFSCGTGAASRTSDAFASPCVPSRPLFSVPAAWFSSTGAAGVACSRACSSFCFFVAIDDSYPSFGLMVNVGIRASASVPVILQVKEITNRRFTRVNTSMT